jgi:hypothetical protein
VRGNCYAFFFGLFSLSSALRDKQNRSELYEEDTTKEKIKADRGKIEPRRSVLFMGTAKQRGQLL